MGFFSWDCKKCDHSIKAPYNIPAGWDYMNEAVLLEPNGNIITGEYDGYGEIEGHPVHWETNEPEMWHKICWKNAGKPEYSGGSDSAGDQGYFYDDPSDEELVEAIRATE
tara:strand:- start:1404 stop:1733 length:330 start_codon:yes stop_codon:yes gene_type:complete